MKLINVKKEFCIKFDVVVKSIGTKYFMSANRAEQERIIKILTQVKEQCLTKLDTYAEEYHEKCDDAFTVQISNFYQLYRDKFKNILQGIVKRKDDLVSNKNPSSLTINVGIPAAFKTVQYLRRQLSDEISQEIINFKLVLSNIERPIVLLSNLQSLSDSSLIQEIADTFDSAINKVELTTDYGSFTFNENVEGHKAKLRQELQTYVSKADEALTEMEEDILLKKAQFDAKQKEEQLEREKTRKLEAERREKEAAAERERMRLADIARNEKELVTNYKKKVELLSLNYAQFENRIGKLIFLNPQELDKDIAKLLSDISEELESADKLIKNPPNGLTKISLQQTIDQLSKQINDIKNKLESRKHNLKMISEMADLSKELLGNFFTNENKMFTFFMGRRFAPSQVDTAVQKFSDLAKNFATRAEELKKMSMPNETELEFVLYNRERDILVKSAEHYQRVCSARSSYYKKEADLIHVTNLVSRLLMSDHLQKLISHADRIAKEGELGQMKSAKIYEFHNRLKSATTLHQVEDLIFAKSTIEQHLHTSICATRSWLGFGPVTSKKFFNQFLAEAKSVLNNDKRQTCAYKMGNL